MIIRAPVPRGRIRHDDRDGIPAALLRSSHSAQKNSIFSMTVTLRTRFIRAAKACSALLGSTETPESVPAYRSCRARAGVAMWSRSLALALLLLLPAPALAGVEENVAALAPSGLVLVVDAAGNEL